MYIQMVIFFFRYSHLRYFDHSLLSFSSLVFVYVVSSRVTLSRNHANMTISIRPIMTNSIPSFRLNTGAFIPGLGLGTCMLSTIHYYIPQTYQKL
jgi:hypothetical protein